MNNMKLGENLFTQNFSGGPHRRTLRRTARAFTHFLGRTDCSVMIQK
jgi:hypothetical protein